MHTYNCKCTYLCHLEQVQGRSLLVAVSRSPALHAGLLVVVDAGLRAAARQSAPALHLRGAVWRAGLWRAAGFHWADLLVREVVSLLRGVGGRAKGEGAAEGLQQVCVCGQTEAGAALHHRKPRHAESRGRPALNASPAVTSTLLHGRPDPRALRPPRRPARGQFVWAGQRAALAFAGRGGAAKRRGFAQTQIAQQTADAARLARRARFPRAVPQALQTRAHGPRLHTAAPADFGPPTRFYGNKTRHTI